MWKDWREELAGVGGPTPTAGPEGGGEASGSWPQDPERWGRLRGGCPGVGSELGAGSGWMRWTQQVHGQVDGTFHGGPEASGPRIPRQRGREHNWRAPTQK